MSTMKRVTKSDPCKICKKEDWCLEGTDISICMRVTSQRTKSFADGSIGYIHPKAGGSDFRPLQPRKEEVPFVDSGKLLKEWRLQNGEESLNYLAIKLGICKAALRMIGCVKTPHSGVWGFPMYDGKGCVIGIRMRHENGRKWCNPGGHNGMFIPACTPQKHVVICEGPTDTAAALHMGLYAVGRFNCSGGINQIQQFIKVNRINRVTIIPDNDNDRVINGSTVNPGIQGAMALTELVGVPSRCVALPSKDVREFVASGGDIATFNSIADQNIWTKTQ